MSEATGKKLPTKGQRTRESLKTAVVVLVNDRAINEIKISDLCDHAGLAIGSFYFHFRGKDDALEWTASEILNEFFAGVLATPISEDLFSEIYSLISEYYRGYVENRLNIRAVFKILGQSRPVRATWLAGRLALVERLSAAFSKARQGKPCTLKSDYVLAQYLLSALERFYEEALFAPSYSRLHEEAANFDVFVRQQAELWRSAVLGHQPAST
jgi:AcrR family transcriptional regulator